MSGIFGGSTTTSTKQKTDMGPWKVQAPYLTDAFKQAQAQYNAGKGQNYTGDFVAGPNAMQTGMNTQAGDWATGAGASAPGTVGALGNALMPASLASAGNALDWSQNGGASADPQIMAAMKGIATGQNTPGSISPALTSALTGAATGAIGNLAGYNSANSSAVSRALEDPTQRLAASAGQYMNSAPIQQAMDSVGNRIDETLHEQTLPGLNRQAAAGGVLNSSRAGMSEAMANRDAARLKSEAQSGILNNAFNTGLSTAAQQNTSGINSAINGAGQGFNQNAGLATGMNASNQNQGQFNTTAQIGAGQGALNSALGYSANDSQFKLGANGQLLNAGNQGFAAMPAAQNLAISNYGLGSAAGASQQGFDQSALVNQYDKWGSNSQYPWQQLGNYMGVVGSNNWGQNGTVNTTSTQTSSPGIGSSILGGLSTVAGLGQSMFSPMGMFGAGGGLGSLFTPSWNGSGMIPGGGMRPYGY